MNIKSMPLSVIFVLCLFGSSKQVVALSDEAKVVGLGAGLSLAYLGYEYTKFCKQAKIPQTVKGFMSYVQSQWYDAHTVDGFKKDAVRALLIGATEAVGLFYLGRSLLSSDTVDDDDDNKFSGLLVAGKVQTVPLRVAERTIVNDFRYTLKELVVPRQRENSCGWQALNIADYMMRRYGGVVDTQGDSAPGAARRKELADFIDGENRRCTKERDAFIEACRQKKDDIIKAERGNRTHDSWNTFDLGVYEERDLNLAVIVERLNLGLDALRNQNMAEDRCPGEGSFAKKFASNFSIIRSDSLERCIAPGYKFYHNTIRDLFGNRINDFRENGIPQVIILHTGRTMHWITLVLTRDENSHVMVRVADSLGHLYDNKIIDLVVKIFTERVGSVAGGGAVA